MEVEECSDDLQKSNDVISVFRNYQERLDNKYNKHEKLVKLSRDVTIESKRIIFLLHRISSKESDEKLLKEANTKFLNLETTKLKDIALELKDDDIYLFLKAISPGLQEYVEAVLFYQYIIDKSLLSIDEIQKRLSFVDSTDNSVQLKIPPEEYLLGLADMTGELMRKCINSVGQQGNISAPFEISKFLAEIYSGIRLLRNFTVSNQLWRKEYTLKQSLDKVEKACYAIKVRGSEIPQHMLADVFSMPSSNDFAENGDDF